MMPECKAQGRPVSVQTQAKRVDFPVSDQRLGPSAGLHEGRKKGAQGAVARVKRSQDAGARPVVWRNWRGDTP